MAKLNNSILTHGVSFPYGNRRLGIARIRRLQFIASPTFGYSSLTQKGYRSALVWVLADNPARYFYQAMGGRVVAERDEALWGNTTERNA